MERAGGSLRTDCCFGSILREERTLEIGQWKKRIGMEAMRAGEGWKLLQT